MRAKRERDDDGGDDASSGSKGALQIPAVVNGVIEFGASLIPVRARNAVSEPGRASGLTFREDAADELRIRVAPWLLLKSPVLPSQESVPRPIAKVAVGAVGAPEPRKLLLL